MNIAIYMRLSKEDEFSHEESNSIAMQRLLLRDYVREHFPQAKVFEFSDDGYSGTNFDRPGVQALLDGVKNAEFNCIIVKDFSRFARDYIELGSYLEQIFPFMGVRSRVWPSRSSRKMVHTFSTVSWGGREAFRSRPWESWATRVFTISISASRVAGAGSTTMLNRRFKAADISLTPLSRVLAVAMTEKPFLAATSSPSSGTEMRFSLNREISASCTSEAQREISSTRAMVPVSMARNTGLCNSMALAGSFGSGKVSDEDLAAGLQGAVIKEEDKDGVAWKEYLENVMKKRGLKWTGLYRACRDLTEDR